MKVNVLGTTYQIEKRKIDADPVLKDNSYIGYCCEDVALIVIADTNDNERFKDYTDGEKKFLIKTTLRHEIIHAFLNESGLQCSANKTESSWAKNEEMVDWIAIQFPKILKAFQEVGAI